MEERVRARIAELEKALQAFIADANARVARGEAVIAELKALLEPPKAEAEEPPKE